MLLLQPAALDDAGLLAKTDCQGRHHMHAGRAAASAGCEALQHDVALEPQLCEGMMKLRS
jgi:hypothetical protein